jgi:hydrogenase maturation factor HypE
VVKPLVLYLLDPEGKAIPEGQFVKALDVIESWMVRRMLVRATTKNYNLVIAELIAKLRESDRATAGDTIEAFLARARTHKRVAKPEWTRA